MSRPQEAKRNGTQGALFATRFLENYAGSLIKDPITALVELVANSWDAGATVVRIQWPDDQRGKSFSIEDNGCGMTVAEFEERWRTLDYDRREHQPDHVVVNGRPRAVFGRNGRGRHAAFHFGTQYAVVTWRDGKRVTFRVSRGSTTPLEVKLMGEPVEADGHGTIVSVAQGEPVKLTVEDARRHIGSRFLHDPAFEVFVDGELVKFDHLPEEYLARDVIEIDGVGRLELLAIDTQRSDRTSKQHGVSWRVQNRLVGDVSWSGMETIDMDRRTVEAKRYSFIVLADPLAPAVLADWSGFLSDHPSWLAAKRAVAAKIVDQLDALSRERGAEARAQARERNSGTWKRMSHASRARWNEFVDRVVVECRSISDAQIVQLSTILANLEVSRSRYGLVGQLSALSSEKLDDLHEVLDRWTVDMAREVLDEIEGRLKFIDELKRRMDDPSTEEVQQLQPLFERGLWMFGIEFESIEYTSNQGMTTVIQKLLKKRGVKGSLNRPDFAVSPDGTVGLYACPRYDEMHEVIGVDKLVIVELKKPGITIGEEQKAEVWTYAKELYSAGHLTDASRVDGFVLGSSIDSNEAGERNEKNGLVRITPMLFQTALTRAERRMMGLYARVKDAPLFKKAIEGEDDGSVQEPLPLG